MMGANLCAHPNWTGSDYVCTPTPTGYVITNTGACSTYKKIVTLSVASGTTTSTHPFGYRLCCNSPLTNEMGIDGVPEQSIDDTSITVGEITVSSQTLEATFPASSPWVIVLLAASVLLTGVYFLSRWSV